jgi:hypothetical protein
MPARRQSSQEIPQDLVEGPSGLSNRLSRNKAFSPPSRRLGFPSRKDVLEWATNRAAALLSRCLGRWSLMNNLTDQLPHLAALERKGETSIKAACGRGNSYWTLDREYLEWMFRFVMEN